MVELVAVMSMAVLAWCAVAFAVLILTVLVAFVAERKSGVSLLPPLEDKDDENVWY